MYQYVSKAGNNECVKLMDLPEWMESYSSIASRRKGVNVLVGRRNGAGNKHTLLIDMTGNTKVTQLPDQPHPRHSTTVPLSVDDVFVVGRRNNNTRGELSSVYLLSLGSDAWQRKKSMPHAVSRPLMIQHQQCIYVLR